MQWKEQSSANRDRWDQSSDEHLREWYKLDEFRQGQSTLDSLQVAEVGDVRGQSLLHLQCNAGLDTLSWARLGATVTGVDISAQAIQKANGFAGETGIPATFICSDIYELPGTLGEKFDIVYTSQGVLCWLNDLNRWAGTISHCLKPGGRFYIMEEHPFAVTLDDQEFRHRPEYPYFHDAEPDHEDGQTYQWSWSIGDIVNSLVSAGLRIQFLNEYEYTFYQRFPYMTSKDGRWWSIPGYRLPLMFTLRATKG